MGIKFSDSGFAIPLSVTSQIQIRVILNITTGEIVRSEKIN
jgi:hypothetical protein